MHYVKIFGKQRTGTTYTIRLVRENFLDTAGFNNEFGHKHNTPLSPDKLEEFLKKHKKHRESWKDIKEGNYIHPLIIIKNPYSWYWSIKKWHAKKFDFTTNYKIYNHLYTQYKDFYENGRPYFFKPYILRYEDLIKDPRAKMTEIAAYFEIEIRTDFINPTKVHQSAEFTEKRKKFYLENTTFDLNKKQIKAITAAIDWELMKFYGYEPIKI
jgi:hypothetical protein